MLLDIYFSLGKTADCEQRLRNNFSWERFVSNRDLNFTYRFNINNLIYYYRVFTCFFCITIYMYKIKENSKHEHMQH